ncbi:hypothetical protein CPC735_048550 [Coccidioides posadasii C735 delta SOWgp]|uniref:Uncharacterized protein n=1 Tax=Coccidioides posadasii (strain C735) TaxID=222929 RepID=C5PG32_COCP7|nr:hypothetical protein CPC735_048550 [Coccidioides posadasii C735 delta SOWgp]EER23485.1 hypothetical protein CPC735_048550 [Coccidioides posadasii C735 delta SOWgp]|eukprot:XP_003065630.1 hypothetical protein CPC735_048550 [Coccidioides posadasii C735 delta SOWgp]
MARISMDPRKCQPSRFTIDDVEKTTCTGQFRFTPRPMIKKPARLWDRKPATPVCPRSKSHKIWKRLQPSMGISRSGAKSRDTGAGAMDIDENELFEEINPVSSSGNRRAVKKLCTGKGVKSDETEWGASFVETRSETNIFTPRRKYVMKEGTTKDHKMASVDIVEDGGEESCEAEDTPGKSTESQCDIHSQQLATATEETNISEKSNELRVDNVSTPAKKPSMIASLLRQPLLEEDDVELLSNFLSEAEAKRTTNNALAARKAAEKRASIKLSRSPCKLKARRALEHLDKNSPTSMIRDRSPSKLLQAPASPLPETGKENGLEAGTSKDEEESAPSPSPRKRGRSLKRRLVPRVPDQIPLRRSKGTEFIFSQKTDTQKLALTTKSNTKQNKAGAKLPHLVMKTVNETYLKMMDASPLSPKSGTKTVTWDDAKLVTFAEEISTPTFDTPKKISSGRRSRRLASRPPRPATPLRSFVSL